MSVRLEKRSTFAGIAAANFGSKNGGPMCLNMTAKAVLTKK